MGREGPQRSRLLRVAPVPPCPHTEVSLGAGHRLRGGVPGPIRPWSAEAAARPPGGAAGKRWRASGVPGPLLLAVRAPRSGSRQVMVSTPRAGEGSSTYPVVQAILSVSWERVRFGIGEA